MKTSTRQTYFLPVIGLVDEDKLKPGDLVGVNKDSYLILETLPAEYDARVKAMEVIILLFFHLTCCIYYAHLTCSQRYRIILCLIPDIKLNKFLKMGGGGVLLVIPIFEPKGIVWYDR